jgi:hypothetical protein
VGDEPVSLHAEGEKMILTKGDGVRREVTLTAPEIPDGEDGPEGDRPGEEE